MMWLDRLVVELLAPLAVWLLANGLDDLYLDWLWFRGWRKARNAKARPLPNPPPARVAILIPCWKEADVIGSMLEQTLDRIDYENYAIWVGVYANDPDCEAVVRKHMERDRRVRMAISPRLGPTTKADCLNQTLAAIWNHERETGEVYELFVLHDAEDIVPPDELSEANRACRRYDMAQFPVHPLPTPPWQLTHGVYCDEFAESHTRDLPARSASGGFVPSAGVATALRRDAVDQCRILGGQRPFDPGSLTEDYVLGMRLHSLGFSQVFLAGGPATREYFPRTFATAVRQRTRWVIGNCLQTWERHGWPKGQPIGSGGIAKGWSTRRSHCLRMLWLSMACSAGLWIGPAATGGGSVKLSATRLYSRRCFGSTRRYGSGGKRSVHCASAASTVGCTARRRRCVRHGQTGSTPPLR